MTEMIIVRNKVFRSGELCFKKVELTSELDFDSLESLRGQLGDVYIMKKLFDEDIDHENIYDSFLYKKYQEILNTGRDNQLFCKMYKLKNDFAVSLSQHIYLHHISTDLLINGERILPWECIDSKNYIVDTWWETDEDIIDDLNNMPYIQFVEKYKAY